MTNFGQFIYVTKNLTFQSIKERYAGSFLGPIWVVLSPLLLTGITTLVFSIAWQSDTNQVPYVLFAFVGLVHWNYFSKVVLMGTSIYTYHHTIITNSTVSKTSLIASLLLSQGVDYLVGCLTLVLLLIYFNYSITVSQLFFWLLILGWQVMFQGGVVMATGVLNAYFRDVQHLVNVILQLLFYATPIIYPLSIVSEPTRSWLMLNPLTNFLEVYRRIFFEGNLPMNQFIYLSLTTLAVFGIGSIILRFFGDRVPEVL